MLPLWYSTNENKIVKAVIYTKLKLGERIKSRRLALGLTQKELSTRAGFQTKSAITRLEADACGVTLEKLYDLALALQTSPNYLMGFCDDQNHEASTVNFDELFEGWLSRATAEEKSMLLERLVSLNNKWYRTASFSDDVSLAHSWRIWISSEFLFCFIEVTPLFFVTLFYYIYKEQSIRRLE